MRCRTTIERKGGFHANITKKLCNAPSMNSIDKNIQDAKENKRKESSEDLNMLNNMLDCRRYDVNTTSKESQGPSKEKAIVPVGSLGDTAIEVIV